ncbi:hypothetical protein ABMA10_18755 [Plantibacter sp. RU18]
MHASGACTPCIWCIGGVAGLAWVEAGGEEAIDGGGPVSASVFIETGTDSYRLARTNQQLTHN